MILASINGTDISNYIQESTYEINQRDVYKGWMDANYNIHREKIRTRVVGSFDLVFLTETDYTAFLTLLNTNTDASGMLTITLYVTNINASASYNVFFEFENNVNREISANYFYKRCTMDIEER